MKLLPLLILGSLTVGAGEESLPNTQRIYTQLEVAVSTSGLLGKSTSKHTNLLTGSFIVLEFEGKAVVLTAAHNLALGPRGTPKKIGDINLGPANQITEMNRQTVLGSLAHRPTEVALLSDDRDVALIRTDSQVLNGSRRLRLASKPPAVGEAVTICGFPGTSHEKTRSSTVAAVYSKHIVLNEPVEHGFSGGVVLNRDGKALAMVTGTEEKLATAVRLSSDELKDLQWKSWR